MKHFIAFPTTIGVIDICVCTCIPHLFLQDNVQSQDLTAKDNNNTKKKQDTKQTNKKKTGTNRDHDLTERKLLSTVDTQLMQQFPEVGYSQHTSVLFLF